ncbi:MAG: zinc ribbon domain-containing protein [Chloroflexi bacterium]|nr:zinc ribbon domain-containing protein [Chloroflexota bacterium]MBT3669925.1 zinc ribbon domain-containing protein [Chloroflexota bacterium]MBT4003998.1 zinc ribbon domain-containing protein [Chloroflexota bacterium]MBT4304827.1 zinc ribbon domain-containing protein [Chloroflexota bacterium]MBT4534672.1 zinc ribbon domain-containing protein [Chloroflexota bacterium]
MNTKTFHGKITAKDLAKALVARFTHNNMTAKQTLSGEQYIVQISTRPNPTSGGKTALGLTLQQNEDRVVVKLGKQEWLGIAASFGKTLLSAKMNPFNLIGRLDDIAQDIENMSLDDQIWGVIEEVAIAMGASTQISERLRSTSCEYCNVANPIGASNCLGCGAPMGDQQPRTCLNCGHVPDPNETFCSNCGDRLD